MRLSILDQVPITEHTAAGEAASSGLRLAAEAEAEELGYHRIWFAEHHRSRSFASTAPETMTALALERTHRVRVGTGGILLPLYSATKVAEVMTLHGQVHGDRIDTGVGRAALEDPDYTDKIATLVHTLSAQHDVVLDEPEGRVWGARGRRVLRPSGGEPRCGICARALLRSTRGRGGNRGLPGRGSRFGSPVAHGARGARCDGPDRRTRPGAGDAAVAGAQGLRPRRPCPLGGDRRASRLDGGGTDASKGPRQGDRHRHPRGRTCRAGRARTDAPGRRDHDQYPHKRSQRPADLLSAPRRALRPGQEPRTPHRGTTRLLLTDHESTLLAPHTFRARSRATHARLGPLFRSR